MTGFLAIAAISVSVATLLGLVGLWTQVADLNADVTELIEGTSTPHD